MTSIINNFEITNDFTITDGNVQIKTVDTTGSLDVSGNIIIGSASSDNAKLIVKNINNSIVELKAKNSNNIETTKSITNKSGVLEFTSNASLNTCLYEFNVGDSDSIGFMNSTGNNKPGIVFGRSGTDSLSVNNYSNAHIFYSTVDGGSVNNALNFTGEKLIFNTSSGNFSTLSQAMIIDSTSNIGMGTASPSVSLDVIGTDAIRIPYGTTAQRPQTDASGCIRYNTQTSSYEGFGAGSQWGSLGGVKDVDQDTYISAETTAGTDNDQLKFYTAGVERMIIDQSGNVGIGTNNPGAKLYVSGNIKTTDRLEINSHGNAFQITAGHNPTKGLKFFTSGSNDYADFVNLDFVRIGSNGNSCELRVVGDQRFFFGLHDYCYIRNRPSQDRPHGQLYLYYGFVGGSERNTGVFLSASPSESNYINNGGNVGIGTTNPKAKLNVAGKITSTDNTIPSNYGGNVTTTCTFGHGNGSSDDYFGLNIGTLWNESSYIQVCKNSSVDSNHKLLLNPNGGNVGIGTDNPGAKLEVSGDVRIGYIAGSKDGLLLSNSHTTGIYSNSPFIQGLTPSFGTNNIALNPNGGNVGIGTNNPGAKLEVNGNIKTTDRLEINSHGNAFQITAGHNPTKGLKFFTSGSNDYADFFNLDFVRIGRDGNSCELRVVGDQRFFFGSHDYCYIRNRSGQNRPHGQLYLYYGYVDGGERNTGVFLSASPYESNYINNGGKVGIGTNSPSYPLDVRGYVNTSAHGYYGIYENSSRDGGGGVSANVGGTDYTNIGYTRAYGTNIYVGIRTTNGVWCGSIVTSSDQRIKENIRDVSDNVALQQLRDISCCFYEYKDKVIKGTEKTIGFIAQQVREHMPMAVSIQKGIIPNEMRKIENPQWTTVTDVSGNNTYKLTISDLEDASGNTSETIKYRFYVTNDPSGNDECEKEITSLENEPKSFIFQEQWQNVFLYGKEIDDFHTLDKQKLFAINFSASQEIDRIQQQEKTKLEEQTLKLLAAEAKIVASEAKIVASEAKIVASEAKIVASEAKIVAAEAKIAASETEINTLKNDNAVLLNKIATLESNFYNLQQQVQTLIDNQ